MDQLVQNHLKKIEQELNDKGRMQDFLSGIGTYSLKEIICSDIDELMKIADDIGVPENNYLEFMLDIYKRFASRKGKGKYSAIDFVDNLEITVCPYCNRAYIQTVKRDNGKAARTCQLDHFFSKKDYPYLALSFFNLVPCCYACNHQKGEKQVSISPYQKFLPDELLTFRWIPKNSSFKFPKGDIEIIPNHHSKNGQSLETNFDVFGLKTLYQCHTDAVKEILLKGEIYSHDYIQSLISQFPDLIESEEEAIRLVTGNYVMEEDLGKRPLAKLTRDIAIETELIKK